MSYINATRPVCPVKFGEPSYSHPEHVTINKGVWMSPQPGVPVLRQVVLDATDVRALAEFYRRLLDLQYRPGDEHPGARA